MDWYLKVIKQYAVFDGRAGRQEFWMFILINLAISIVLSVVEGIIGLNGILSGLYSLAVLLPTIGVSIRRLHDTGRPGWWLLMCFVPIIGIIVLIIFYAQEGQSGSNQYGASPQGA